MSDATTIRSDSCANCGAIPELGFPLALCSKCRNSLAATAFPSWIKVSALAVVGFMVCALIQAPRSFEAALAFQRGRNAEQSENYSEAVLQFSKALEEFSDSPKVMIRLASSLVRAGRPEEAATLINSRLEGRKLPKQIITEANALIDAINAQVTSGKGGKR